MNPDAPKMTRAWLMVGLLWVVALLNYLDRVMITTMRGSLTEAIPMTDAQFGLLTSVFAWVYGLLSPFAGFMADRFSRSRVILGSLFVWSLLTWLTGHAKTFEQLLAVRALMGISEAAYIPAALALISDYHRGNTRSLATGIHMTGIGVGAGLGGLGGWLAERHGWSYAFTVFGLVGVGYAVVLMLALRDAPAAPKKNSAADSAAPAPVLGEALASLFRNSSFWLMLVYWGLLGLTGWAVMGWMPTFFAERFALTQGVAGLSATGYLQAAMLLGVVIGGVWADRWSRTNQRARILVPAIGLCISAPGLLLLSQTSVLPLAIVGLMIHGLARSFTDANMMPALCLVSDPRYRATGYGVLNLCSCLIGGSAAYFGGALRDAHVNLSVLFLLAALNMLVCAAVMFCVKPAKADADGPLAPA
ncbi:MAG: MFS transporter [Verrucomicrobia bacterium]|nr:MFS transporter [Verrucomicrobiota bacterium]